MVDTAGQIALTAWMVVLIVPLLISVFGSASAPEWVKITAGLILIVAGVVAFIATIAWIWS